MELREHFNLINLEEIAQTNFNVIEHVDFRNTMNFDASKNSKIFLAYYLNKIRLIDNF